MKKNIYFVMALAAGMLAACSSDDDIQTSDNNQEVKVIASLPQDVTTRVAYSGEGSKNSYSVKAAWESGDNIRYSSIVSSSANHSGNRPITITGSTGTFGLNEHPDNNTYFYCYYPMSAIYQKTIAAGGNSIEIEPNNNVNYIFSSIAEIKEENLLVGTQQYTGTTSDLTVQFKNVWSLLKINLKIPKTGNEGITKITNIDRIAWCQGNSSVFPISKGKVTMTSSGDISWASTIQTQQYSKSGINAALTESGDDMVTTIFALVTPQDWDGFYIIVTDDNNSTKHTYYRSDAKVTLEPGAMYIVDVSFSK